MDFLLDLFVFSLRAGVFNSSGTFPNRAIPQKTLTLTYVDPADSTLPSSLFPNASTPIEHKQR